MNQDGYARYQQSQLTTSSPAKLLLAAYDGALKFCRIGGEKMKEGDLGEQSVNINKALAIVCELLSTLNEEASPKLVGRLRSLYTYVIEKLAHANLHQDQNALREAVSVLSQLRETWAEAEMILRQENQREEAA